MIIEIIPVLFLVAGHGADFEICVESEPVPETKNQKWIGYGNAAFSIHSLKLMDLHQQTKCSNFKENLS